MSLVHAHRGSFNPETTDPSAHHARYLPLKALSLCSNNVEEQIHIAPVHCSDSIQHWRCGQWELVTTIDLGELLLKLLLFFQWRESTVVILRRNEWHIERESIQHDTDSTTLIAGLMITSVASFDTGGTTRRRVTKLFACLRTDRRLGELWEAFQKPRAPHRQSRLSSSLARLALMVAFHWWPPLSKFN